jgi:predicted ribonuclease YlaK
MTLSTVPVPPLVIQNIYRDKEIVLNSDVELAVNDYAILQNIQNPKQTAIGRHLGYNEFELVDTKLSFQGLSPRDASQTCFMAALANPEILLSVATGQAGSGKTTIAVAWAIHQYFTNKRDIILCKPTTTVGSGRGLGAVPGGISEKLAPYLDSYNIILNKVMGKDTAYREKMIERGELRFISLDLIRGSTFENCTFILDEAQNTNWHEMNTLISRMGEKSELILTGDPTQMDCRWAPTESGLYKLTQAEPFADSDISSCIELQNQYRSAMCELATSVNTYLYEQRTDVL